jgi:predicted nuclease of restriction endonuclease-like RecB superfamily
MLPGELLAVWKRKGVIWPRYSRLSKDDLAVAASLIEAYKNHVGKKKNVVKGFVDELEDEGYEYRFVRGLAFILDKRSVFKCTETLNPTDLRRRIFQASAKLGFPTTHEKRKGIIETLAAELKLPPQAVEEGLYADLDSELILEKFDAPSALELLEDYNLSLTQTLLFDSTELSFTASGNWQRIFYTIKRLGLIYDVSKNGEFHVKVDGPASLFKLTRRYGTATAKLLPVIIANKEWTVEAKILWKYTNEICNFKIESWKHRYLLKKPQVQAVTYDSVVEEDFAVRFDALKSGWSLKREPEPVPTGRQVIIPDFSVEREGIKVYLEVVGFWTLEYLLRKMEKLKKVDVDMLVAVNESLACDKLPDWKHTKLNVMYYRDKIPLQPVLRYLEEAFHETKEKQTDFVKNLPVTFTEPIVNLEEFASRIGVSLEALKTALTEKPPKGYTLTTTSLVSKEKIENANMKIIEKLGQTGRLPLTEAAKIIETEGIPDTTSILQNLGYKITWHGISPEKAEITRPASTQ